MDIYSCINIGHKVTERMGSTNCYESHLLIRPSTSAERKNIDENSFLAVNVNIN
jgi:hypothetical protein